MAKDVLITPASGLVDFKDTLGASDATIQLDDLGTLHISNPGGELSIGDGGGNLFIGDGATSVDIVFEQNGAVRALTGKTLTIGQSDSNIAFAGTITSTLNINTGVTATGINLNNNNIVGVNNIEFSDPGPSEGLYWVGGSAWKIYESPNDLTTNSGGNLQFATGSTRRATFNTSGQLELPVATGTAPLVVASTTVVSNLNADLLDGQQGSYYQSALGFTPVQQGGVTGQGGNKVYIGWASDASGLMAQVDSTNFGITWPINISKNAATVTNGVYTTGDQTINGTKLFAGLRAQNQLVITGGSSGSEGAQLILGYGDGLASNIAGQTNNTWNIDVIGSTFRVFRVDDSGSSITPVSIDESTGDVDFIRNINVYGITIGRGSGAIDTNTVVGSGALVSNTTGNSNVAIGKDALRINTTGNSNVAISLNALRFNTSGTNNVAIGNAALYYNTIGNTNTAVGGSALNANTTGGSNVAIGSNALSINTGGSQNVAVGVLALQNNNGSTNTGVGYLALRYNTTGNYNVAIGGSALNANTTGYNNTAVGSETLYANTTGASNTAVGYGALNDNTTGNANTAIGINALSINTGGSQNVAVGVLALQNNNGTNNIGVGYLALRYNTAGNSNVAVGVSALQNNTTGGNNTASGSQVLLTNTTGFNNTASGHQSLYNNTTGGNNTASGSQALYYNTTGSNNTASGNRSLFANTTGNSNTAIGHQALFSNTTGSGNISIGPFNSSGTYAPVFDITTENNRVNIGSTAVTNAYIQVAWTVVSDARDKTDFAPVPYGLDFVTKLKPVAYRYKINRTATEGHGPVRYGFKAQDVLELEGGTPVIVDAEDKEKLRFNDQSMIAVLVNAIQELKAEFDAYKATHP